MTTGLHRVKKRRRCNERQAGLYNREHPEKNDAVYVSDSWRIDLTGNVQRGRLIGGASIGVVIAYLAFFHGDVLASLFTNDGAVIARAYEYLQGFALEAIVTSILFSFMGYFNGHSRSLFVMIQGLAQSFLVRLPMSYLMSIHTFHGLTGIGLAAPTATVFGIIICLIYYLYLSRTQKDRERPGV